MGEISIIWNKSKLRNEKSLRDVKRKEDKDLVARNQNLEKIAILRPLSAECQSQLGDFATRTMGVRRLV